MSDDKKPQGLEEASAAFRADAPQAEKPRNKALKIRRIGNSLGVVLPKDVLAKLRAGEGDHLSVTETPEGVLLSAFDDEVERQMASARDLMHRYRNALRELAK